ncbi:MAG: Fe-S cluster assembly protein SufD [Acidobacteriota bacterium]
MIYHSQFEQFREAADRHSPEWLRVLRRSAMQRFTDLGFPTTRDEEWRYTNVSPIARAPLRLGGAERNGLSARSLGAYLYSEVPSCNLVFVNGRFSKELSSRCELPAGVEATSLAEALLAYPDRAERLLSCSLADCSDAFRALNTAFLSDGAFVHVPDRTILDTVIHIVYASIARDEAIMSHPRNLILVGRESQARIVETYVGLGDGQYLTNALSEITAGENSTVEHYKLQRESEQAFHIATLETRQSPNSSLVSHAISLGGSLVRSNIQVILDGEGAQSTLNGLYVTRGVQHMDNRTLVDHARAHCSSRQNYKGILDDRSSAAFGGKIVVRQDAQKTDARQSNRNLVLSKDALVDTKPQLEIYADDVKCTHGATIGKLDDEALFYLRSRGISRDSARTMPTYAFASEIIGSMKIKPIQCQMDLVLLGRLSRDGRLKEVA